MPSPVKPCALCLLNKPLLASHFLPAAIYKNLIDPTGPIRNMIASNLSTASEESKQVKQYLLCQDCEIRFQQGGENWILGRRLMPSGGFELRDLLRQATPVETQGEASLFALNTVPSFEKEQLLYFAASIFWRAAVADWETPVGHYTKLAVDPGVVEELRKYLLGSPPFPSDVCSIVVIFSAADAPKQLTTLPHATTGPTGCQQFDWYMPGIGFTFLIGNLPVGMQAISVSRSPHCVAIDPKLDQRITAAGVKHAQESTATEKLQKKLTRQDLIGTEASAAPTTTIDNDKRPWGQAAFELKRAVVKIRLGLLLNSWRTGARTWIISFQMVPRRILFGSHFSGWR